MTSLEQHDIAAKPDVFELAHNVRCKLLSHAKRHPLDLRRATGHANLLDSLLFTLEQQKKQHELQDMIDVAMKSIREREISAAETPNTCELASPATDAKPLIVQVPDSRYDCEIDEIIDGMNADSSFLPKRYPIETQISISEVEIDVDDDEDDDFP